MSGIDAPEELLLRTNLIMLFDVLGDAFGNAFRERFLIILTTQAISLNIASQITSFDQNSGDG